MTKKSSKKKEGIIYKYTDVAIMGVALLGLVAFLVWHMIYDKPEVIELEKAREVRTVYDERQEFILIYDGKNNQVYVDPQTGVNYLSKNGSTYTLRVDADGKPIVSTEFIIEK